LHPETPKIFTFKKFCRKIIIFCARRIKIKYKFPRFFELDGKPPPAYTEVRTDLFQLFPVFLRFSALRQFSGVKNADNDNGGNVCKKS